MSYCLLIILVRQLPYLPHGIYGLGTFSGDQNLFMNVYYFEAIEVTSQT